MPLRFEIKLLKNPALILCSSSATSLRRWNGIFLECAFHFCSAHYLPYSFQSSLSNGAW